MKGLNLIILLLSQISPSSELMMYNTSSPANSSLFLVFGKKKPVASHSGLVLQALRLSLPDIAKKNLKK